MVAGSRIVFEMTEMGSSGVHFTVSHAEYKSVVSRDPVRADTRPPWSPVPCNTIAAGRSSWPIVGLEELARRNGPRSFLPWASMRGVVPQEL